MYRVSDERQTRFDKPFRNYIIVHDDEKNENIESSGNKSST